MSRNLTTGMVAASQRASGQLVLITKIETDAAPVLAWTGSGDLDFEGEIYSGVGELGAVSQTEETLDLAARGLTLSLSGVPNSLLATGLTDMRQGREVTLWLAIVKNIIDDNYITNGFFDTDISSWIDSSSNDASINWNPLGYLDVNDTAIGDGIADQQMSGLDITKQYILSYEVKEFGANGPSFWVGTTQGTNDLFFPGAQQGLGLHKAFFNPTVTNPWLRIHASGVTSNDSVSVDNIFVIENEPVPLIADPYQLFKGETDAVSILEGAKTSMITVNAENRLIRLEKKNERRFTTHDQQQFHTGDLGLDYVVGLVDKEIIWGKQ